MSLRALFIGLLLTVLVAPVSAFAGGWMIYHDGPYTGVVLDDETGEPIVGAAVVAEWYLNLYGGAGGPISEFFDARETITDDQGKFSIDSKIGFYWWPFASINPVRLTIYKPGYDSYPPKLPMISSQSSVGDMNKADLYRKKFYVKITLEKINIIRLAKAATHAERRRVLPGFERVKDNSNLIYVYKLIDLERIYLGLDN